MKTYSITIKPSSGFGTSLKGDTLFGHICWQAAYDKDLFGKSLDELLAEYSDKPFVVVSSAFPKIGDRYAFKRPDMPLDCLFPFDGLSKAEIIRKRKEYKGKRWMFVESDKQINSLKAGDLHKNDNEIVEAAKGAYPDEIQRDMRKKGIKSLVADFSQPHNTINRLTGTTGEGRFAPFSVDQKMYIPLTELSVFIGVAEDFNIEQVKTAFQRIGDFGFGKDASTGLGKFSVSGTSEIDLQRLGAEQPNACYTLSPCVPEKDLFGDMFFTPFTRFGRHGDVLAKSKNPFKNPVIMADEGAVFIPGNKDVFKKPYIGTAVTGISKAEPNAAAQGYALYIPVRVEV